MNLRRLFREAVAGLRHHHVEPDPFPSAPGVSSHDAAFIADEAARRRFEDVEFEGPGAEAAYARRDAAIARRESRIPARGTPPPPSPPPKKKARKSKRERLEAKARALREEIERLKKK